MRQFTCYSILGMCLGIAPSCGQPLSTLAADSVELTEAGHILDSLNQVLEQPAFIEKFNGLTTKNSVEAMATLFATPSIHGASLARATSFKEGLSRFTSRYPSLATLFKEQGLSHPHFTVEDILNVKAASKALAASGGDPATLLRSAPSADSAARILYLAVATHLVLAPKASLGLAKTTTKDLTATTGAQAGISGDVSWSGNENDHGVAWVAMATDAGYTATVMLYPDGGVTACGKPASGGTGSDRSVTSTQNSDAAGCTQGGLTATVDPAVAGQRRTASVTGHGVTIKVGGGGGVTPPPAPKVDEVKPTKQAGP